MHKPICIYHGNCADGFGAAWVIRFALGENVEFHAGHYGNPPPDVAGRDVIMVDFSFKRPVLLEMAKVARSILVLDHHKSAAEDLAGFPEPEGSIYEHWMDAGFWEPDVDGVPIRALFDMDRSGAGMAWDYFFPGQKRPALINHIEDRDLWRFRLDGTREIQAAVFSYPYDFDAWDRLFGANLGSLRKEGEAIERKHHKDVAEMVKVCQRRMVIGGFDVPAASLPYIYSSDAGHVMAKGEPFAACYWDTAEGRTFSLRSSDEGEDVSAIASQFGGGGHRNAAGFRVGPDHELAHQWVSHD
ncbi:phosphohydrolase [Halomonas daqingensis]|uniref:Phosphohydrolase n=1 Tax=Billgrantia desiderata TaxID=52021 RepID=A0ABS9B553_9GAMM|nr:hypothetical protein [Halomonas desiderata]MCE8042459.1 phosphohydrolase [Halomonas desiderata]MCE8047034.1 phosphohydrolase [Halomonas desiderata]